VLVIAGPRLELPEATLAAIDSFLVRGGAVLALLDPGTPAGLAEWCRRYGLVPEGDVLISRDRANEQFGVSARTITAYGEEHYGRHPITRGLAGVVTLFPLAQSLTPVPPEVRGVDGFAFLMTGSQAWSERDPTEQFGGRLRFDPGHDRPGPLPFGFALEIDRNAIGSVAAPDLRRPDAVRRHEPPESNRKASVFDTGHAARLVMIGNSEFATNANLGLYGNRDLLLNIMGWLAREELLIDIRGRDLTSQPVVLRQDQKELLGWSCVVGWPLAVGVGSLVLVLRHRRKG
jgi:hypothetical protein